MTGEENTGLVAGRFRVGGLLGSGGTASVFRARDEVTGQSVAVKLLHPHLSKSEALRQAFLMEARRTAHVSHPSIVAVIDMGTFDDHGVPIAWIAQQLVDGVTLSEHVRVSGPLSVQSAAAVTADILDALGAAHAVGLVHRDVSPSNVLVRFDDEDGVRATLLDFGLADADGATARGDDVLRSSLPSASAGVVGNAEFASPEQLSGLPVGPRGDIYQAGGMLYFSLTGRAPFAGGDRAAIVRAHLNAPPPVPSVLARSVPTDLDRVVVRSLLKNPSDRFADAGEMRAAILDAVSPVRLVAVPPMASTRVLPMRPDPGSPDESTTADTPSPRQGLGWGAVAVIVLLLAGIATAVPLMASAGRAAPGAEVPVTAASPTTSSPTPTTPTPQPSLVETAPPLASAVVPSLGSLTDARAVLTAAGFTIADVVQREAPQPAGTVIAADPAPGATVPYGSAVRLVVASGSNLIPDVVGMDAEKAAAALRDAGFSTVQTDIPSDRDVGTVMSVEPAAGSSLRLGGSVSIRAAAPRPTSAPVPPSATSTPTATPTATAGPR